MAANATFALNAGVWFRRARLLIVSPDSLGTACPPSGRNSTYRPVQISEASSLPEDLLFATETTFRLSADTYLEPDFVFYAKATGIAGLNAATAKLAVEIADTSLGYDLGRKAALYAAFGIAELWVIDAVKLATRIHRDPSPTGYRSAVDLPASHRLVPASMPALAVVLSELELH
jgi:Uma2 family endonuclease